MSWVGMQDSNTSDDLAHRVMLLSLAGEDASGDLSTLLTFLNSDNGWGSDQDFSSDILDTTLALQALNQINYNDLQTISYALGYLIGNQNTDGGFGFYAGDGSNVYMTALLSMTLQQLSQTVDLATAINKAMDYLIAHQNTEGGFGEWTVYETALALIALIESNQQSAVSIQNAINYLITTQLPNGSWNDDPYSTALAL